MLGASIAQIVQRDKHLAEQFDSPVERSLQFLYTHLLGYTDKANEITRTLVQSEETILQRAFKSHSGSSQLPFYNFAISTHYKDNVYKPVLLEDSGYPRAILIFKVDAKGEIFVGSMNNHDIAEVARLNKDPKQALSEVTYKQLPYDSHIISSEILAWHDKNNDWPNYSSGQVTRDVTTIGSPLRPPNLNGQ